ncbi:MAG: type II secretion system protein [Phycisphaeraceae bacterium]|nr:type II secretion system protein [Phycisphaeraceae bacterium]
MRTVHPRGFTLVEIMVVAIILAVIGAMVLPRLVGKSSVTAQLGAEQLASMLGTFAFRASLASQPVALMRDGELGTIEVWILDTDPSRPENPPDWRLDRFSRPLQLPEGVVLSEVVVNGQRLMPDAWRVVATPGIPRPLMEFVLASEEAGDEITVVLEPRATAPFFITRSGRTTAIGRTAYDLDREGREKEPW